MLAPCPPECIIREIRRRTRVVGASRWPIGLDAECGPVAANRREQMGPEALPQHGSTQGPGAGRTNHSGLSAIPMKDAAKEKVKDC
jgi:hypothetical protein